MNRHPQGEVNTKEYRTVVRQSYKYKEYRTAVRQSYKYNVTNVQYTQNNNYKHNSMDTVVSTVLRRPWLQFVGMPLCIMCM
jgi:homoserine kinase